MGPEGTGIVLVIFAIAAVRLAYHISEAIKSRREKPNRIEEAE